MVDFISLLSIEFLGNEVWRILIALIVFFMYFPVSKVVQFIVKNYLTKWSEKSEIKFDDVLIKSLNPSIKMFLFAGFIYLAGKFLTLSPERLVVFNKVLNFFVIIPVVYFLIKFSTEAIGVYLMGEKKKHKVNEAGIDLLMQIIRIVLFVIGMLLILSNLGYNVSALVAGLGVGGLAFALAAQDLLKNFFAGISLVFDRTFNKGEIVKFNGYSGIIEELKLRTTKLRTYDGTLLTIPNAQLSDNIVENVTKVPRVKVKMTIGVTYDTSTAKLKKAKKIIYDVIDKEPTTDSNSIWVWFDSFGAYSLDIHVIYYGQLKESDWPEKVYFKDRVNFEIKEKFERAGIDMAFPTQTVEVVKKK